jgi:hypothetical protein
MNRSRCTGGARPDFVELPRVLYPKGGDIHAGVVGALDRGAGTPM